MEPKEALKEVLRSDEVYELNRGSPLGEWRPDRLKLARRPLVPQPIAGCVSKEAQRFLRDTPGFIVKSESDLAHIAEEGVAIRPYWDKSLRSDRAAKLSFLKIIHRSGLLAWRRGTRADVAPFL